MNRLGTINSCPLNEGKDRTSRSCLIRTNEIGNLSSYFSPHFIYFPVFDCADKNMNYHSPPPDSPNFHCSSSARVYLFLDQQYLFYPSPLHLITKIPETESLHQTFSTSDLVKSTAAFRLTVVCPKIHGATPSDAVKFCPSLTNLLQMKYLVYATGIIDTHTHTCTNVCIYAYI